MILVLHLFIKHGMSKHVISRLLKLILFDFSWCSFWVFANCFNYIYIVFLNFEKWISVGFPYNYFNDVFWHSFTNFIFFFSFNKSCSSCFKNSEIMKNIESNFAALVIWYTNFLRVLLAWRILIVKVEFVNC